MTVKKKKNDAIGTLNKLIQEILFMRPFEFHTAAAPEDVRREIDKLPAMDSGGKYDINYSDDEGGVTFAMTTDGNDWTRSEQLYTHGRIFTHGGTGETVVRGRIQMKSWLLITLMLWAGVFGMNLSSGEEWGINGVLVLIYIAMWVMTYQQRNKLYERLRERVFAAPAKAKAEATNRLQDKPDSRAGKDYSDQSVTRQQLRT